MDHPRNLKQEIKRLASIAHEREMRHYLECLHERFAKWKNGELDPQDLVQDIHEFHNGSARNLYNAFQTLSHDAFLARAFAGGYLAKNELPEDIREDISRHADILKG
jgi:hypothetical protein